MRDYKITQTAAIVDRACRLWEGEGIWSEWMRKRYVKTRPIHLIQQKQEDFSVWKATLRNKEQIAKCAQLQAKNSKVWIGKGGGKLYEKCHCNAST